MEHGEGAQEARAILEAYKLVKDASWPELNPTMASRAPGWARTSEAELRSELAEYVREISRPGCPVRVFWKMGSDFAFAGSNEQFAKDAGFASAGELIGLTDFSDRVPWQAQASKYRHDDEAVTQSGQPSLDILERQHSATGTVWVLVGKAPIRTAEGRVIGILGMYQQLEKKVAERMFLERSKAGRSQG